MNTFSFERDGKQYRLRQVGRQVWNEINEQDGWVVCGDRHTCVNEEAAVKDFEDMKRVVQSGQHSGTEMNDPEALR